MERWKAKDPCANVHELAKSLPTGVWLNLLVPSIADATQGQVTVLGAELVFADPSFAILRYGNSFWMLHADETYAEHPLSPALSQDLPRGAGCEIRLQGCDPDASQDRASDAGWEVVESACDKPHGLREAFLRDTCGFIWVPCVPSGTP